MPHPERRIGVAHNDSATVDPNSVFFAVPYNDTNYTIELRKPDLDTLLTEGLQTVLRNRALHHLTHEVPLPNGDLPLLIGPHSIETETGNQGFVTLQLGIIVATKSIVHEHRGILLTKRRGWDGTWNFESYKHEPELQQSL